MLTFSLIMLNDISEFCQKIVLRSEEHTSELQSRSDLVCRLLLEKKKLTFTRTAGAEWSSNGTKPCVFSFRRTEPDSTHRSLSQRGLGTWYTASTSSYLQP